MITSVGNVADELISAESLNISLSIINVVGKKFFLYDDSRENNSLTNRCYREISSQITRHLHVRISVI